MGTEYRPTREAFSLRVHKALASISRNHARETHRSTVLYDRHDCRWWWTCRYGRHAFHFVHINADGHIVRLFFIFILNARLTSLAVVAVRAPG